MSDWSLDFYYRRLSRDPEFEITKTMLHNAGIGRSYWRANIDKIPNGCAYKEQMKGMISTLPEDCSRGKGAIFHGNHGYGKTSAACVMLKAAMVRGGHCFHRLAGSIEHAYEKRWLETNLDGVQVWDLLTQQQLVTLDDLGQEQAAAGYKAGDIRIIEELIRSRYDRKLPTYITTNLPIAELGKQYPTIGRIFYDSKRYHLVKVDGHFWSNDKEEF